jgi:outer membrane protein OmpA-like peptidoglycan-associated protein
LDIAKVRVGQTLQINNLYFAADSTNVTDNSTEVLIEVFEFMDSNKNVVIEVGGHTNNQPAAEYCDRLSTARAKSVAEYLYNRGIDKDRISYKGYGKNNPIATNDSVAGRKKNQRVEIKILRLEGE